MKNVGFVLFWVFVVGFLAVFVGRFDPSVVVGVIALVFVYVIFCRVAKIVSPVFGLLLPITFITTYSVHRTFVSRTRRRVWKVLMVLVVFLQPLCVFSAIAFSFIGIKILTFLSRFNVVFFDVPLIGFIAKPWLYHGTSFSRESVLIWWLTMNAFGMVITRLVMHAKDYSAVLKDALLRFPEFKAAKGIKISKVGFDLYQVNSDAAVSHETLLERKEQIGAVIGAVVIGVDAARAGVFDFYVGELNAKRDSKGRYISTVKWEEQEFLPVMRRGLFKSKVNHAARVTIPIGKSGSRTVYLNLLQAPHFGGIGVSNSGKTSALIAMFASLAYVDPQTIFIMWDIKKKGNSFRLLEVDPNHLFSPDRPTGTSLGKWHKTLPRLANVIVIKSLDEAVSLVRMLEREIAYREKIMAQHPEAESLYDLEFDGTIVEIKDHLDPARPAKIVVVIDDYLNLMTENESHESFMSALTKINNMVSYVRYLKIHIGFMSQKGTVKVLDNARDQLAMMAFGTPPSVSEYVLKKKINVPSGIGIFGFVSEETGQVGVVCAPRIKKSKAADILAEAEARLFDYNRATANMLAAALHAEGDTEVMEGISEGQALLLELPIEFPNN